MREWLINTRSPPLGCSWLPVLLRSAWNYLIYLDDWQIFAQSGDELLSHRSMLLSHLECLGLWVNFAKSLLSPSQRISFLRTVIDSARMRAVVTPERALAIQQLSSRRLFILVERLLRWAQLNLRSLRATHVLGKLNLGADMLSLSNVPSDEWTLHPQTVQVIWAIFGKARG